MKEYIVTEYVERDAPYWLIKRINWGSAFILWKIIDGAVKAKGVRIGHEVAKIGEKIVYDGKRISVERKWSSYLPSSIGVKMLTK